jgi:hypothetical protein
MQIQAEPVTLMLGDQFVLVPLPEIENVHRYELFTYFM